ncbi:MAG: VOC family protein [Candidatus Bathyarchaeota archaeon]|nr:VOC family protein [Candidatus Bathyarchaeota archaeon]
MAFFDHIGIYVTDMERSLRFYTEVLGFQVRRRLSVGESLFAVLDVGGGLLELIQHPGAVEAPRGRWSHVAFHIEDYDGLISKLEEMGLELRKVTLDDSSRLAFFKDPDGHDIEIMEKGLGQ